MELEQDRQMELSREEQALALLAEFIEFDPRLNYLPYCRFCEASEGLYTSPELILDKHLETCLWRRAVKLIFKEGIHERISPRP